MDKTIEMDGCTTPEQAARLADAQRKWMPHHDNAHRDAWAGLSFLGLWDEKITPEMVGRSFGEAIDSFFIGWPSKGSK